MKGFQKKRVRKKGFQKFPHPWADSAIPLTPTTRVTKALGLKTTFRYHKQHALQARTQGSTALQTFYFFRTARRAGCKCDGKIANPLRNRQVVQEFGENPRAPAKWLT